MDEYNFILQTFDLEYYQVFSNPSTTRFIKGIKFSPHNWNVNFRTNSSWIKLTITFPIQIVAQGVSMEIANATTESVFVVDCGIELNGQVPGNKEFDNGVLDAMKYSYECTRDIFNYLIRPAEYRGIEVPPFDENEALLNLRNKLFSRN